MHTIAFGAEADRRSKSPKPGAYHQSGGARVCGVQGVKGRLRDIHKTKTLKLSLIFDSVAVCHCACTAFFLGVNAIFCHQILEDVDKSIRGLLVAQMPQRWNEKSAAAF